MSHPWRRYVALGDSLSEGLQDLAADGAPRGWADRLAQGLKTGCATACPTGATTFGVTATGAAGAATAVAAGKVVGRASQSGRAFVPDALRSTTWPALPRDPKVNCGGLPVPLYSLKNS